MSDKDAKPSSANRSSDKRSGRVTHDARGNPVWEWQVSTGVFEKDATTQSLKKLEAKGLSLMDTQSVVKKKEAAASTSMKKAETTNARLPGGGVNPYDNSGRNPSQAAPARTRSVTEAAQMHPALAHKHQAARKEPPRQSLQSKYHGKPEAAKKKPSGLLGKLKSVLGVKD